MASVVQNNGQNQDDQNNPNQNTQNYGSTAPQTANPSQPPQPQGQPQQTQPQAPNAQKQGSGAAQGFAKLRSFVTANQGAGQKMAQGIQSGIQQTAQKGQENLGQQYNAFQQAKQAEQQRIGQAGQFQQQVQQDPTKIAQDQNQMQQFQALRTGQGAYQTLGLDATQAQQAAQKVAEKAQLAQSETGRYQLLRDQYSRPTYTQGQSKLDQLLMQTQGGAGDLIRGSQQTNQMLQKDLSQKTGQAQADVNMLKTEAQKAQEALTGELTTQESALEQDLARREQEEELRRNTMYDRLTKGELTAEDMGAFGLSEGQKTYGLSKDQLLGMIGTREQLAGQLNINKEQLATEADKARASALAQLGQKEQTLLAGQIGGLQDFSAVDRKYLQDELSRRQKEYESLYNPVKQNLDTTQGRLDSIGQRQQQLAQIQQIMKENPELMASATGTFGFVNPNIDTSNKEFNDLVKQYSMGTLDFARNVTPWAVGNQSQEALALDTLNTLAGTTSSTSGVSPVMNTRQFDDLRARYNPQLAAYQQQMKELEGKYGGSTADLFGSKSATPGYADVPGIKKG